MKRKFWNFKNEADEAELLLYGDISDETWYGDEVTPKAFAEDLASCGGKKLNIRINSPGGDVFAAQAIYNQLKRYSGDVSVTIDGMCASAATIIACAGSTVTMPSNAVYMIHNPACVVMDAMTVDDAKNLIKMLETTKDTILAVYHDRVAGKLSDTKLSHLMDNETWMSASEALANGFVDAIDEQATVEDKLDGNMLIVNSVRVPLDKFKNAAKLRGILAQNVPKTAETEGKNVENNEILKKIKDMLGITEPPKEEPHLTIEDAVKAERERMSALDALKNGNPAVDAIVETAKKNGQTVKDVQPFVDAMPEPPKEDAGKALDAIRDLILDNMASGAEDVKPEPVVDKAEAKEKKEKSEIDAVVNLINANR